ASAAETILRDRLFCRLHDFGHLGDHPLELRTGFQNRTNNSAESAAYVGDRLELGEVVGFEERADARLAEADHAFVKQIGFVLVFRTVNPLEVLLAEYALE